jgi:hypothetical protein
MRALLVTWCMVQVASCVLRAQAPVPNVPPKFQADTVNIPLAWEASPSAGVTKTVVRRGNVSGTYTEMVELPASQLTYTWPGADAFASSFFVVTAKNAAGEESAYSNEVEYKPASGKLIPPKQQPLKTVTAKFRVTPPVTIEQVGADGAVRCKMRIFIDDGDGNQNLMLTTTEGSFRKADKLKLAKPSE